ncbi:hypothetical protein HJD18_11925 [Thermoleophilia bacterium SCSIO 60948]|nr:hypothetical protein HJD18_11925 [Thermoleophilia bacterium SCSIO 60948]
MTIVGAGALALAGGIATAGPPAVTDDLDSGAQGWELYLASGERQALDWSPGGGYVSADVDGPETDGAAFGDAAYVSDMSRYAGENIVFQLRSSLGTGSRPTVWLYDYYYDQRLLWARAPGPAVGTEWNDYRLPLEATSETHWFNKNGERVSKRRFDHFLRSDPSFIIEADLSDASDERTDLDNPGLQTNHERRVRLRYLAERDRFKGLVRSRDFPACSSDQKVQILKKVEGNLRLFAQTRTNTAGRYSVMKRPTKGRYFARAIESTAGPGNNCLVARSKTVRAR